MLPMNFYINQADLTMDKMKNGLNKQKIKTLVQQ
jgi:hypothetical protein